MLDADLQVTASIDLDALFTALSGSFTGADLGEIRFDASAILNLVASAAPPDLAAVLSAAGTASITLTGRLEAGVPGAEVPSQIDQLISLISSIGQTGNVLEPTLDLVADTGLDSLLARTGSVISSVEAPLGALFNLIPDLHLPETLVGTAGTVGGLVELARVLAGLTATAAVSDRLVGRADLLAGRLDVQAAQAAANRLGALAADTGLVAALRSADPDDPVAVEVLGRRVVAFLDAVLDVEQRWTIGMGVGEAALVGLDLAGGLAGLELARLAMANANLETVGKMAADVRAMAAPVLELELPVLENAGRDVVDQALDYVGAMVTTVRSWDPATLVEPVTGVTDLVVGPLDEVRLAVESVAGTISSAIRTVRQLVDEVDLTSVAEAVQRAMQPVIDTLDAIEAAVGTAEEVLLEVCGNIEAGLQEVAGAVTAAAGEVREALGRVDAALDALHLADLAENLRTELGSISAALGAAQLTPYFDAANDVIDTGAQVIDAVPFGLLPTDVQQEIVDLAKPIKALDLQAVEDTLRVELAAIQESLHAEVLDAIDEVYQKVVAFLASLDPEPALLELETGPLEELRAAVAAVDPAALLAPAEQALDEVRGLLDGIDLKAAVLDPLADLFEPVLRALAELDPAHVLDPLQEPLDQVRQTALDALHLDDVTAAVTSFRDGAAEWLGRVDPMALAAVLDEAVAARLRDLPKGPPGGAFGSLLVKVGQSGGLDLTEPAVADMLAWISGREDGATVVRARMRHVADQMATARDGVAALDPVPLTAAAGAQQRAISGALQVHAPGTQLRLALDPLLAGVSPSAVLGPLAENRRRYLVALQADAVVAETLAASGRSEVTAAAAGVTVALLPLLAIPARLRDILSALGVDGSAPLSELVIELYDLAGPARILPAIADLVAAGRDALIRLLDVFLQPALDVVDSVRGVIEAFDLQPIVDELVALHTQITGEIVALSPEQLLGGVLTAADQVIARLRAFDPLAPVQDAVTAAKDAAAAVLDEARPTIVFADVVKMHATILALATGLDVRGLLAPVLTALDVLAAQLDQGFDRTGDALQRLQAALPDHVEESPLSIGVSIGVEVGF
ncbi:hypothetical protein [Streptomyces sp. SID13031]|uniref:hypothetical protein n=1 Tax=Streptomyces sp. SID13031 TaxID=2706046 RepID=UPI0013C9E677|nr:hypothetical protein [Streptomyces sp. SID13031]NEA30681.1 hypothetical protein [Streptomyces sp. SID13031]